MQILKCCNEAKNIFFSISPPGKEKHMSINWNRREKCMERWKFEE